MRLLYLTFMFSVAVLQPRTEDVIAHMVGLLRQGNLPELYRSFAPNIDLSIAGEQNTYTKQKAEAVLSAFFAKNQPLGAKLIHRIDSNADLRYAVIILSAKGGNYRVSFSAKNNNGVYQVTELSIQEEKAN